MILRATIVLLLALTACRSLDPAVFDERLRTATFDAYWTELDRNYPYFAQKHVDWRAVRDRYREDAITAPTRPEFFKVLVRMLSELDDPHVSLEPGTSSNPFASLAEASTVPCALAVVDRRLYAEWLPGVTGVDSSRVDAHVPSECPGLVSVDGFPVHSPWPAFVLLCGEAGTSARLTLEWRSKGSEDVVIERPRSMSWSGAIPFLAGGAMDGDVGYVWMRTFDADRIEGGIDALAARLDLEIDRALRTRALVLDLQYNDGGDLDVLKKVLGRLVEKRVFAGRGLFRHLGPFEFESDVVVDPRPPTYAGELVVLVNAETASAAEWLARVLQREKRAILVGERTAGAEAATEHVKGPDGTTLVYGRRTVTDRSGRGIQDVGVEPDVPVPLTLESVERHGYNRAQQLVREERLRRALEFLGAEERFEALRDEALHAPNAMWENGRTGLTVTERGVQGE